LNIELPKTSKKQRNVDKELQKIRENEGLNNELPKTSKKQENVDTGKDKWEKQARARTPNNMSSKVYRSMFFRL